MDNTIFDDVFKTLLEKCKELIVPVINEVFKTDYSMKEDVMLWSNELLSSDKNGQHQKKIADSIIEIADKTYHIECQSTDDNEMEVRMVEYDFRIAYDRRQKNEDGEWVLPFPKSAVIYLRHTHRKYLKVRLILPDETEAVYQIPAVNLQDYSKDEIFDKKLLFFLPYYILRFENELGAISQSEERLADFKKDYADIYERLKCLQEHKEIDVVYLNKLVELIKSLVDYVAKGNEAVKEVSVMGGRVLELETDRILNRGIEMGEALGLKKGLAEGRAKGRAEGRAEGRKEGRITLMIDMYVDGVIDYDTLIERIEVPEDEVKARLANVAPAQKSSGRKL